ncbi:MAG: hypothetical protein AB8I08_14355 [Sandaracinaceae bacterium]
MPLRPASAAAIAASLLVSACNCAGDEPPTEPVTETETETETEATEAAEPMSRLRFNQLAMRLNLPLFWAADTDEDGAPEPDEVRALAFYPTEGEWVRDGEFTDAYTEAYDAMVAADAADAPEDARLAAVHEEFDTTAPTLVENDLSDMPEAHRAFAGHMARVAGLIDQIYAQQVGMAALADQVADDPASQSLFRRNWGPRCKSTTGEANPACSAIEDAPQPRVDVYPAALQADGFCEPLEARDDASTFLSPFTVVRGEGDALTPTPYTEAYAEPMQAIATELRAAADAMTDENEEPLRTYLRAAAQAFTDNQWEPADEAWAAMNVRNSQWYVRVGPDEVYWDPCSQHAGFHLTFARINQGSLQWQDRLTPLQSRMEASLSALVPDDYTAREVSFHLPDFIDIVINAGDDRDPYGATIGQSLPNWGPVSDEGRGRTVAMTNLYQDPDSRARGRAVAESLLTEEAMAAYTSDDQPGLLSTILHEATHNLGPASGYEVDGQEDTEVFGGGLSSMLEELKAQSGALFFVEMLREEGILTDEEARQTYLNSVIWAFGHISRGMYTPSGQRKAYSQLAAIQVGFLMDQNVLSWDPEAQAADGETTGAFNLDYTRFAEVVNELMTQVMHIKGAGDRAAAEALATRFVDGDVVPMDTIAERYQRFPRTSFVYAFQM